MDKSDKKILVQRVATRWLQAGDGDTFRKGQKVVVGPYSEPGMAEEDKEWKQGTIVGQPESRKSLDENVQVKIEGVQVKIEGVQVKIEGKVESVDPDSVWDREEWRTKRVARRFLASGEITVRDIDRWKKDLRRMTKIYRSIPRVTNTSPWDDPKDWERAQKVAKEAKALWRTFKDRFETWGYRVVLPKVRRDEESWLQGEIRSAISDAVYKIGAYELFPEIRPGDGSFQRNPDIHLSILVDQRKGRIKGYQRPFIKLFKLLDDYISSSGGALERRAPIETYQVAGMTVVVDTYGMRESSEEDMGAFFRSLQTSGIKPIQRAGFGVSLKGLTLHASFDRNDTVAGQYETAKDVIKIFPLGFTSGKDRSTFIHEVGHRFYYRNLPSNARTHWEETIEGRVTELERIDIKNFVDIFLRPKKWMPTRRELASDIQRAAYDPETEAKYLKLADELPGFTSDPDEVENWWLGDHNLVGERVQLEEITEYGTTNPVEAFAEAFTEWVQKGPGAVSLWTQNFFRVISRGGGAKIAERVARRFLAKKLTKPWLMGVRRTWVKLLSPSVSSWNDIQAALKQLRIFIHNLKDEVFFIRRGLGTGDQLMLEGRKVDNILAEVDNILVEAKSQATHWQDVMEGRALPGFTVEQAEQSLRGWSTDFEDAISASIHGSITKVLDKALKLLRVDAKQVTKGRPEVLKEFSIGNMKFVLVLGPNDQAADAVPYVALLKKAHALVQSKNLNHLWYGICFLAPRCEKLNEQAIQNYERAGYDRKYIKCRAGWYRHRDDTMAFTSYPTGGFIYGMIHELGHRHWFKFMASSQRVRYGDLIKSKAVGAVSDYGKSNPEEAFAEAFAHYITGKDMTRDQMESFRQVAFGSRTAAQRVTYRWLQTARRFLARAIRLDKGRIKELAKELESVLAKKSYSSETLGNRMVVPAAPYDITTVDGGSLSMYVRLQAIETKSPYYVVDGGFGFHRGYQTPIVIVNINGSMSAEKLRQAAKARQVQNQLYPVLLHEMTHAADKYSKGVIGDRMTKDEAQGNEAYYNNPGEVRAYMQEVVDEAEAHFQHWPKLSGTFGPSKAMSMMLNMSPTWTEVSPHWSERNKRLVTKAVVQALNDWENEQ